ncbi:peptidoglycan DD-metalloendopeptidase family protein [Staphylococcus equorum]|uniref:peptidoglycan DD-metalloendopeptidase family protein n=1 Tax=Staphylococcus equorum TaxID=246432 RepID=UPI003D804787
MADFNLSAEVSMDVDPLKASKTTIERNLKAINKSLRDQRKEFKQNEASAESLAKQETDLGRAVKLQEGLLKQRNKTLDEMQRQMKQSNQVTDEQKIKLQNASRAVQQAENQLNGYENELKQTQAQQKLLGRSTDTVKNSLGQLRNEAKLTEMRFKQSEKSVSGYKNRLTELSHTMQKQKAHSDLLKGNLKELERAQQGNSREAKGLRNDIIKEALAFQVLQGRIDETTDELKEYQRQQRLMGTATRAWVGAREQMDRIATTLRSLGELTQGIVGGVMATHFSALVPILGSIVSLGAGLGGMLVATAGGAIGLGGAFAIAGLGAKAMIGMSQRALTMLEDGTLKATAQTERYNASLSGIKTQFDNLVRSNQANIFNTMSNGIDAARFGLTQLSPAITKIASITNFASKQMLDWVKNSNNAKNMFTILNKIGPKVFADILNATLRFGDGAVALFNRLNPLFTWASQGFQNMAISFQKWANSTQTANGINDFIEYTKTNLPIVGSIFGNIFSGIVSLFQAFSGHSHTVLLGIQDVTKGFAEWSAGLKKSDGFQQFVNYLEVNGPKVWTLIKNITSTLWGLAKGMAPVGAAVLSMSGAFFKWTATMTNAHPILGKILGIMTALGGVTLLAAKPIILLRGALLGATGATKLFGKAGAIAAIKTNVAKTATKLWTGTITLLSTAMKVARGQLALQTVLTGKYSLATKLAAVASRGLGLAIRFMTGPIGWVITIVGLLVAGVMHLWKTNATFRNAVISIWNSIKSAAIATFGFLKPYIVGIWNGIKTASIFVWNVLKSAAIATWNGIKFAVQNPMKALKGVITAIWNGIKTYFTWVWGLIKATVSGAVNGISNVIKTVFGAINTFIRWIFNGIANFVKMVWNSKILAPIRWAVQAINVVVRIIFAAISKFIKWIFNGVASFVKTVWNNIKVSISFYANLIKKLVTAAWNILSKVTKSIFNGVKNFLIGVWSNIRDRVVSIARAIWSKIKPIWDTLSRVTRNIFNSIKNFLVGVWTTIRNRVVDFAKSLWAKVKPVWDTLSRVSRNIFNSLKNFFVKIWTTIRNKVSGFASSMWSKVSGTWDKLSGGTKKIFNSVRNYLVDKWNGIKDKVTGIASSLWSSVKETFTNMKDGLKGLAGKIGDVITGMVKGIKKGLNALIKGVNWVAKKLGVDEKIPELSTGTVGASQTSSGMGAGVSNGVVSSGGFATVNDRGPGNGTGASGHQEVIQRANGQMLAPKGRDVTVPLGKGDVVHSGRAVQRAQQAGMFPKFSRGTGRNNLLDDMKKKKHKHGDEVYGDVATKGGGGFWEDAGKMKDALVGTAKEGGKKAVVDTTKKAADTTKAAKKTLDDVMSFVGSPMKLVESMMKKFGVDFGNVRGQIPKDMMWDGMWKGLKGGVKSLFDGWLTEAAAGSGDGGYIDLSKGINFPFSPHGRAPGYPFPYPHNGIDINYIYDKLYSVASGTATSSTTAGGFGKHVTITDGIMKYIYGHMSKFAFNGSKKVKPGDYLGVSGNTGMSSGPHLHFEVQKNNKPIDPLKWLKENNGGGKGGGKYGKQIKQALGMAGLPQTSKYIKAWQEQARTESTFNPKAKNPSGASGLVQVKPATFAANKLPGHGNIWNPLDNLIAGMRYAKGRYGVKGMLNQIGHGLPYKNGTNNATKGFHQVFEEGGEIMQMRGGETVIPNDVSIQAFKQIATSDIFNRTQTAVYDAISQYADQLREKQQAATREQQELQRLSRDNADIKEQNSILKESLNTMKAILGELTNTKVVNQEIRDKNYFPSSREMTKMNNENMALNSATQLMR